MSDLSQGVIVVLSGGPIDLMNPVEVRARMNGFIRAVNADPYVQQNSGCKGLTFHLVAGQAENYLHQTEWLDVCKTLKLLTASPLILVGHSNGGAAAMRVARCLQDQGKAVDLLFTADSVLTLDDIKDPQAVNRVPDSVRLNINTWVILTLESGLEPFPTGTRNKRESGAPLANLLNVGLRYKLGAAMAHRNAFYHPAGGDEKPVDTFEFPSVLLQTTLAVLRGDDPASIIAATVDPLQAISTGAKVEIELETATFTKTLKP